MCMFLYAVAAVAATAAAAVLQWYTAQRTG